MKFSSAATFVAIASVAPVFVSADIGALRQALKRGAMRSVGRQTQDTGVCVAEPLDEDFLNTLRDILSTTADGAELIDMIEMSYNEYTIGMNTALIPEAGDASETGANVADGESGDLDFPHGNLKPIATVGEVSICPNSENERIVGVPDGMGAYLSDDNTIRVIVQSESYGPITAYESYPLPVNGGTASFTGSHVQYVDYVREMFSTFLEHSMPASDMVSGFGELIETAYNLAGELVGPRNPDGPTTSGAHYSNTDSVGNYVVAGVPSQADWVMQSLCSAHLEQKHQWGEGIGLEDDIFMTNEEWMRYVDGSDFVGIAVHAIDIRNKVDYAVGVFTQGGYEKIVEINPQNPDLVMFAMSGYNGDFSGYSKELEDRNAAYPEREWVWTKNIVPARIYVGVKGLNEAGEEADDFLSRNGLRYGKIYGYAVPKETPDRDAAHKVSMNGAMVAGKWVAIDWAWDGVVKDYSEDGGWHFQMDPPGNPDYKYWTAAGSEQDGEKMEHCTPDPREGITGYVQGSTAGYFGHYYVTSDLTGWTKGMEVPSELMGEYYVYQGEQDVRRQIELGGKGQYRDGYDATVNYSKTNEGTGVTRPTNTFEDIDGLEVIWDGNDLRVIIQEDSGNYYGERMFISSPLEHEDDGNELTYYFIAMSGGKYNTRMSSGVGIPRGTNTGEGSAHEFSGVFDLSGLLAKDESGDYIVSAADTGLAKREADCSVSINDKYILLGLQSHNLIGGMISAFQADRGGQWLVYQPDVP